MKKEFALTRNAKHFTAAAHQIIQAPPGIDRMMLVFGDPGLGKTESALWWTNRHGQGAVYIRTKKLMNGRWLLGEIIAELGESPAYRTEDRFRQCQDILMDTDRVVILDEVDYLTKDARVIETVRDLHDICGNPWIFIGMDQADKKLKRYRHLWRRFSQVVKFSALDRADVAAVLAQICEIPADPTVADYVCKRHGNNVMVSDLYRWAQLIEQTGRKQNIRPVTPAALEMQNGRTD